MMSSFFANIGLRMLSFIPVENLILNISQDTKMNSVYPIYNLPLFLVACLWIDCSYGDGQSLLQAHLLLSLSWLLTVEIHRTLAHSPLLWRQQILAVEQLWVPVGISLDTAVVVAEEFIMLTNKSPYLNPVLPFWRVVSVLKCIFWTRRMLLELRSVRLAAQEAASSLNPCSSLLLKCSAQFPLPHTTLFHLVLVLQPVVKVGICSTQFSGLPTGDLGAARINSLLPT